MADISSGAQRWTARPSSIPRRSASSSTASIWGAALRSGRPIVTASTNNTPGTACTRRPINHANGARITIRHRTSTTAFVVDARAFDDAVAFRIVVEGTGRRVPDAATSFRLPAGSILWSHGLRDHYEALYERRRIEDVGEGEWAAPPITVKLAGRRGYAAITEADLRNYAGMALQADGRGGFREKLAHDHPPGYPYTLRFGEDNAKRLAVAAAVEGRITTPWRVVIVGRDLNTLVNSDAVAQPQPAAGSAALSEGLRTAWLKPGRAVWRYLDGGESTPEGIKEFSRLAGELGFEYQVIEGQWAKWTADQLRDVVEYSKQRGVGILVWRHRQHARGSGGTQSALRVAATGRRRRRQGRLPRSRSEGGHRPLSGHPRGRRRRPSS